MTIGTDSPYTGSVAVVNCLFVFLIHVVMHFMTGDAELHRVRGFHRGIETTPEKIPEKKPTVNKAINEYFALG